MKSVSFIVSILAVVSLLHGCTAVGAAVGAGATVGVAAASERGVQVATSDVTIHAKIQEKYFSTNVDLSTAVNIVVYEGRVLLTGSVDTEQMRATAVKLTWQVDGVEEVFNELSVASGGGIMNFTHDTWITTKLKAAITFDDTIYAINYSVETSNQVVYVMGIAQSQNEIDRVIAHARSIDYVKKVISHARIKAPDSKPDAKTTTKT
ncbi:MAG: BON domain-containing protein [Rhodospirillales bacterium]|nr:BON domain-containing protein [Rhodospirillales bacterium]